MKKKSNNAIYVIFAILALAALSFVLFLSSKSTDLVITETGEQIGAGEEETTYLVPADQIVQGAPKDGIPAIDSPKFVAPEKADTVSNSTLGVLVRVGNDTRFYPYNIMLWHEIVNDVIGGKPLTVTFCPLCATGIVFERDIGGTTYSFGVSGKLYNSNLVMYDRQTGSYWSQAEARAIAGEFAGSKLVIYPSSIIDFKTARESNPGLKVLSTDTGKLRDYTFDPYSPYYNSDELYFPVNNKDARLPVKALVYGIWIDDKAKAYEYQKIISGPITEDVFNGHDLTISAGESDEIVVFDNTEGKRIIGIVSYWFSWAAHNPETELWK